MNDETKTVNNPERPDEDKYRVGRPTAFTDERKSRILNNILEGAYRTPAAVATGISETTWFRWTQTAKKQEVEFWKAFDALHGEEQDIFSVPENELPPISPYLEFLWQVEQAEAEHEQVLVGIIKTESKLDWKAALEMLTRKQSYRWARETQKHELALGDSGGSGLTVSVNYIAAEKRDDKKYDDESSEPSE